MGEGSVRAREEEKRKENYMYNKWEERLQNGKAEKVLWYLVLISDTT